MDMTGDVPLCGWRLMWEYNFNVALFIPVSHDILMPRFKIDVHQWLTVLSAGVKPGKRIDPPACRYFDRYFLLFVPEPDIHPRKYEYMYTGGFGNGRSTTSR